MKYIISSAIVATALAVTIPATADEPCVIEAYGPPTTICETEPVTDLPVTSTKPGPVVTDISEPDIGEPVTIVRPSTPAVPVAAEPRLTG